MRTILHLCSLFLLFSLSTLFITPVYAQLQSSKVEAPNPHVVAGDLHKIVKTLPTGVDVKWIVPPEPGDCEWEPEQLLDKKGNLLKQWEHCFQVTHIKFDYEAGHANDGYDIRWTGSTKKGDLSHGGEGVGSGEFIQPDPKGTPGGGDGPEDGRSDPVLWNAGTSPKIQVRIKLRELVKVSPLTNQTPSEVFSKQ